MATLKRMRTINQAVDEIKGLDPNSAITYYFINSLCKQNLVHYINIGSKRLVDLDSLLEYLGR